MIKDIFTVDGNGRPFRQPSSHYLELFDAAQPKLYEAEAEFTLDLDEDELILSLPLVGRVIRPDALDAARSIMSQLAELDAAACAFLFALPGWPYGNDAYLWLLMVEDDNVRFCYHQHSVNDEQVVGFRREENRWHMIGIDRRWRG